MSEQLDPEVLRELLGAYREACAAAVAKYDGRIARYIGDGILVYFGYPRAHEDDPRRAVHAGLEILNNLRSLSGRFESEIGVSVSARLGIHTGIVVAGDLKTSRTREGMAIVGQAPNVAARLHNLANPGKLVISGATHQLVAGLFSVRELGYQNLPGVARPVAAYEVLGPSDAPSPFEVRVRQGLFPFVGRERELSFLSDQWTRALNGDRRVVLLSGEAGIGKSRLIRNFRERIGQRHTPILCYCSPYHSNSAFYPIAEQFKRALHLQQDDSPNVKLDKLDALLRHLGLGTGEEGAVLAAALALENDGRYPSISFTPRQMKTRAIEAAARIVAIMAARRPVFMVVEDAHWIDPSSLELLIFLIQRLEKSSILFVISHRAEFRTTLFDSSNIKTQSLLLDRLESKLCGHMITSVAGGKAVPARVQAEIIAKADGIPLFLEELTKAVLESGLLAETDGAYVLSEAPALLSIPSSLKDSLMARLDRLGRAKEVAQLAAVIGRRFSPALLVAASLLTPQAVTVALSELTAAQLIYRNDTATQELFEFKHALVQDTAYESLLKPSRAQLHGRIADVIEHRFPHTAVAEPELLAHHYTQAGLAEKAVKYWQRAGQLALERAANVEALAYLNKALEILKRLPETAERNQQQLALLVSRGLALTATRSYASPEVGDNYSRAHELCRRLGDVPQVFPVLHGLYRFYLVRAELAQALAISKQLLQIATTVQNPTLRMEAHQAHSFSLGFRAELNEALHHCDQCVALFTPERPLGRLQVNSTDTATNALCLAALVTWLQGFLHRSADSIKQALTRAREINHPYTLAWTLNFAAVIHQIRGEVDATRQMAAECVQHSLRHEFPFWLAGGQVMHGWSRIAGGENSDEAIAEVRDGLANWQRTGAVVFSPYFLCCLLDAYRMVGRSAEGFDALTDMIALVQHTGERWWEPELHRIKGEILLDANRDVGRGQPEACFRHAIALAKSQGSRSLELRAASSLARLQG